MQLLPSQGPPLSPPDRPPVSLWIFLAATVAYAAAVRLGIWTTQPGHDVAPIWPAMGLSIWLVVRFGPRLLLALAFGELAANLWDEVPVTGIGETIQVSTMALGNILTAFTGAALWRRWQSRWAGRLADFCEPACAIAVSLTAPVIATSIGVGALFYTENRSVAAAAELLLEWWTGDAIGSLFLFPFLLTAPALGRQLRLASVRNLIRGPLLLATCAAASWLIFAQAGGSQFLFVLFPLLLLATLWFEAPGARLATLVMAVTGIVASARGRGPFAMNLNGQDMVTVQLFLSLIGLVGLILPVLHAGKNLARRGPLTLLLTGWVLAGLLFAVLQRNQERENSANFITLTSNAGLDIQQRVTEYVDLGRSGAGFLRGSREVDRAAWATYVQALDLLRRYPGLVGLGVVYPVPVAQTENFLQRTRADAAPNFEIQAVPNGKILAGHDQYVLTYLEPNAATHRAIGLNLASEAIRRTSADLARDTGEPQLSDQFLLFDDAAHRTGFLLYVPVYRAGRPTATVEERRAALEAWIVAPFLTQGFLHDALGRRATILQLSLFSGAHPDPAHLVSTTAPPGMAPGNFERVVSRTIFGRPFTLGWNRGPGFVPTSHSLLLWLGLMLALAIVLLTGWIVSLEAFRERAEALVLARTAALHESEARYRALVEWSPHPLAVHRDGRVLYVNPAAIEMFGGTCAADLVGKPILDLVHPNSRRHAQARVNAVAAAAGRAPRTEEQLLRLDGTPVDVEAQSVSFPYEGAPAVYSTARDLTEQKIAEAALCETAQRFRDLVDSTDGIVWEADARTFTFNSVSNNAERLLGYPVANWLQPGFWASHILADDREVAVQYCAACTGRLENHDFEYRFIAQDGRTVWLRDIVKVVATDGKPRWLRGLMLDITTQKQAAQTLQLEQAKAERYLEVAETMLLALDPEGRITLLNRKGYEVLGYQKGELTGRAWFKTCLPAEAGEVSGAAYRQIQTGEIEPVEYHESEIVRRDGTKRLVAWHDSLLRDAAGKIIGTLSSGEDITDKKAAQNAIGASLREKEALLKEVHHRVNNNLQIISSLLRLEAGRNTQPDTKAVLTDMQGRIRSMALLHESLYRSGTFAAVDLGRYLQKLSTQAHHTLVAKPGTVRLVQHLASVTVEMDQAMPCGLLMNELLSNCLKHGFRDGQSGEIRVELQPVNDSPRWRLRVSDTGAGLPADFESRRGQSLGLQLVSDLAKKLGGPLEVAPGPAADFSVTFTPSVAKIPVMPRE